MAAAVVAPWRGPGPTLDSKDVTQAGALADVEPEELEGTLADDVSASGLSGAVELLEEALAAVTGSGVTGVVDSDSEPDSGIVD
jgi:hypothetical protein